jgi:hypothetical protein
MALWKITSAWEQEPQPGSDRDFARSFTLSDGKREVQSTVEFARPSRRAGPYEARYALAAFVDHEEPPPRRLLVSRDERVSVVDDAE